MRDRQAHKADAEHLNRLVTRKILAFDKTLPMGRLVVLANEIIDASYDFRKAYDTYIITPRRRMNVSRRKPRRRKHLVA